MNFNKLPECDHDECGKTHCRERVKMLFHLITNAGVVERQTVGDIDYADFILSESYALDSVHPEDLILAFGEECHVTVKDLERAEIQQDKPYSFMLDGAEFRLHRKEPIRVTPMDKAAHIERHKALHRALDELLADWITEVPDVTPSSSTLFELMEWSHKQTIDPSDRNNRYP